MASGDQGDHRRRQAEIHRDDDRHQRSATDPRAGRRPAPANGPGQAPAPVRPPRPDPSSADLEQAQQSGEQQNAERGEGAESPPPSSAEQNGARGSLGPFEFHSEKWEAAYVKRIVPPRRRVCIRLTTLRRRLSAENIKNLVQRID